MVSMSYVAWLADFMRVYGTEPAQLLHGTGVDGLDLADPAAGISDSQHIVLLRNAMRLSGDPTLGLEMGYNRHISTLDRFGFAMMCCETFREALRVGFEYQRVVGRFSGRLLFLSAHEEADTAVIQIEVAPELGDLTRFAVEEILGSILASTRWISALCAGSSKDTNLKNDRMTVRRRLRVFALAPRFTSRSVRNAPMNVASRSASVRADGDFRSRTCENMNSSRNVSL